MLKKIAIEKPAKRLLKGTPATEKQTPPSPPMPDLIDADAVPAQCPMDRLLRPDDVAGILGVSERTLERWRMEGTGPRFLSLSRKVVRYDAADLRAFLDASSRTNTAA